MDFLQVHGQDAGVNLRGGKGQVAEEFLDVADAGSAFQHLGRAGVAEAVSGRRGRQACRLGMAANDAAQDGGREAAARVVDEQAIYGRLAMRPGQQGGPDLGHVAAQVSGCGAPDGNDAVAPAFALDDAQGAVFEVDIVDGQPGEFQAAEAGGVEQLEHGPVAVAARGGHVGLRQQPQDLFVGEHTLGQVVGFVERREALARVDEDLAPLVQEGEERFDDPHLPVAVGDGSRPALLAASHGQRAVIVQEVLQGHVAQIPFI